MRLEESKRTEHFRQVGFEELARSFLDPKGPGQYYEQVPPTAIINPIDKEPVKPSRSFLIEVTGSNTQVTGRFSNFLNNLLTWAS